MSIRIIEISTGLPMDFNWYFIEISTGFPMGIHWNFFEISIELQLDFQCASTWPASSQKFPRTSRTKLTKKKPVYVSGPAMALHQKQHWSDPLWDCHSLPPSPPPPLSSPWTPPATPPRWELLRRTFYFFLATWWWGTKGCHTISWYTRTRQVYEIFKWQYESQDSYKKHK